MILTGNKMLLCLVKRCITTSVIHKPRKRYKYILLTQLESERKLIEKITQNVIETLKNGRSLQTFHICPRCYKNKSHNINYLLSH